MRKHWLMRKGKKKKKRWWKGNWMNAFLGQMLLKWSCGLDFLHLWGRGDIWMGGSDYGPFEVHANLSTTSAVVS